MADTPGKILSSFNTYSHEKRMSTSSSSSGSSSGFHSGGCSGIFFEILDRFHHKGFIPHKLLPAARPKAIGKIEKLPMAKLLLIADENRIGSSLRSDRGVEDECVIKHEEKAQISSTATATATTSAPMATSTRSLSIVARLMGLETIPSSPSIHEENHHHQLDLGPKNYNGKCIVNTHIEHCFPMLPKNNCDEEEGKQLDHIMMESMSTCSTDAAAEQNDKLDDEATIPCCESKRSIEDEKSLFLSNLPPLSLITRFDTQQFSPSKVTNHHPNNDFSSPVKSSRGVRIGGKEKAEKSEEVVDNNRHIIRSRRDKRLGKEEEDDSMHNVRGEGRILSPSHGGKSKGEEFQSTEQSTLPNISIRSRYATTKETALSSGRESMAKQSISSSSSSSAPHKNCISSSLSQRMLKPPSGSTKQRERKQPADTVNEGISKNRRKSGQHNSIRSERISSLTVGVQDVCAMKHRGPRSDDGHESQTSKRMSTRIMSKHEHVSQSNTQLMKKHPTIPSAMSISSFTDALSSSSLSSSLCSQESVVSDAKKCSKVKTLKPSHRGPSSCSQSTTISKGSSSMKRVPNETTDMALSTQCSSGTGARKERKCNEGIMTSSASESDCALYCEHEMKHSRGCKWENVTLLRVSTCEVRAEYLCADNNGISSSLETSSSSSCMEDTNTTIEMTPRTPSSKDSDSTLDSFCGEECGQPSPISTLDFPPDASSNCSDTCDTPRGKKQGYLFECIGIARRTHVDDEESSESGSMIVGGHDKLPITDDSCHPHLPCHASVNAECRRKQISNEKDYVNEIIEEATVYAEKVLSGRLALSSDLINPTLFIKLEEQTKYSDWWEHPREKQEEDDDLSTHELQCGVSRGKSALYRRKLVFDCINEALRCKLDMVTKQSFYLFAPSLSILVNLSVPKILDGVCKQINEWNRIAMNRYMDDMMKREINDTLGWGWSTSGHEMDVILINIEDFILGDLVGETVKVLLDM